MIPRYKARDRMPCTVGSALVGRLLIHRLSAAQHPGLRMRTGERSCACTYTAIGVGVDSNGLQADLLGGPFPSLTYAGDHSTIIYKFLMKKERVILWNRLAMRPYDRVSYLSY